MPERIQRRRVAGWRMPPGAVYVGRPTRWGNPYKGEDGAATSTRAMLVGDFREWLLTPVWTDPRDGSLHRPGGCTRHLGVPFAGRPTVEEIRSTLAGRDLACWCHLDQPCHADVLLELANEEVSR